MPLNGASLAETLFPQSSPTFPQVQRMPSCTPRERHHGENEEDGERRKDAREKPKSKRS